MWKSRAQRRQEEIEFIVKAMSSSIRVALEAVSETTAKTVNVVIDAVLGPRQPDVEDGMTPDQVAAAIARLSGVHPVQRGPQPPVDGQRPEWADPTAWNDEEDPDPTNLDQPLDTIAGYDGPLTDLDGTGRTIGGGWGHPLPSINGSGRSAGAFIRPGESIIPTED